MWSGAWSKRSSLQKFPTDSWLAQLSKHQTDDPEVVSSNPTRGNFWKKFILCCVALDLSDNLTEIRDFLFFSLVKLFNMSLQCSFICAYIFLVDLRSSKKCLRLSNRIQNLGKSVNSFFKITQQMFHDNSFEVIQWIEWITSTCTQKVIKNYNNFELIISQTYNFFHLNSNENQTNAFSFFPAVLSMDCELSPFLSHEIWRDSRVDLVKVERCLCFQAK